MCRFRRSYTVRRPAAHNALRIILRSRIIEQDKVDVLPLNVSIHYVDIDGYTTSGQAAAEAQQNTTNTPSLPPAISPRPYSANVPLLEHHHLPLSPRQQPRAGSIYPKSHRAASDSLYLQSAPPKTCHRPQETLQGGS